jgi:Tol biopolymer transport system component
MAPVVNYIALLCSGMMTVVLACGSNPFSSEEDNASAIIFTSFRTGDGEIYQMTNSGDDLMNLTNHPGHDTSPGWSPDRQRIVFTSTRDSLAGSNLYIMNADGSSVSQLTHIPGSIFGADWSPDGTQIAFSNTMDLLTIQRDGTGLTFVTDDSLTEDSTPDWSPDGRQIAFTRISNDNTPRRIMVMNADGSNQVTLAEVANGFPRWSPDGKKYFLLPFKMAV